MEAVNLWENGSERPSFSVTSKSDKCSGLHCQLLPSDKSQRRLFSITWLNKCCEKINDTSNGILLENDLKIVSISRFVLAEGKGWFISVGGRRLLSALWLIWDGRSEGEGKGRRRGCESVNGFR